MQLAVDLYPARLDTGDGYVKDVRLWITNDGRAVVHQRSGRTTELYADVQTEDFEVLSGRKIRLTLQEQTWEAVKSGGCGCGSPLKRLSVEDYGW